MVYGKSSFLSVAGLLFATNGVLRLQKQKQQQAENAEGKGPKKKKVTAAQLRVQRGIVYLVFPGNRSFQTLLLIPTPLQTSKNSPSAAR
jgi:hypothetical protein